MNITKNITAGDGAKKRAEDYAKLYGGTVIPLATVILRFSDTHSQNFQGGFAVVSRTPKSKTLRFGSFTGIIK